MVLNLIGLILARLAPDAGLDAIWRPFAFYVAPAIMVLWMVFMAVWTFTIRRRIARHGGLLCPGCRYSLQGSPAVGTCPECGRTYSEKEVRAWWRECYGFDEYIPRR